MRVSVLDHPVSQSPSQVKNNYRQASDQREWQPTSSARTRPSLRVPSCPHVHTGKHTHLLPTISSVGISSSAGRVDLSSFLLSSSLYVPCPLSHSSSSAVCLPAGSGSRRWVGRDVRRVRGRGVGEKVKGARLEGEEIIRHAV